MTKRIAISGKGGSGKTTFAAMIIRSLLTERTSEAVLAVDADPNSCLGLTLGVQPPCTVADIREESRSKSPDNVGMDKVRSVEYGIQQAITEANGFDLLTMGRPEGPSCYCAVNNMLRKFLDELSSQYKFVVVDNEAGMEHLSRRTTNDIDLLCIVTEPTAVGEVTAQRIVQLSSQLPLTVRNVGVVWNKADTNKKINGIDIFGHIPYDPSVSDASMQGKTVFDLEKNNPALEAVTKILEHFLVLTSS
jgi:CO dehydrogenase maturation factor